MMIATVFFSVLFSFLSLQAFSAEMNTLKSIQVEHQGTSTLIHMDMVQDIQQGQIEARFMRRTIEWDLAGVQIKKDKMFVDVEDSEINNIYASQPDQKGLRIRINLNNEKVASNYHEQVQFLKDKNKLTMVLDSSVAVLAHNIKELSRMYDVKTESMAKMQDHIAQKSVLTTEPSDSESETPLATNPQSLDQEMAIDDTKEEREIPLAVKNAKVEATSASGMGRMAAGFMAVLLLMGSMYFVNKKLKEKKSGVAFNHDSIKVVSQKYLGPKRQLTLVRVSGEYLLLGVTDHNISLIKQLSVIDDEIPDLVPQDFKTAVKRIDARTNDLENQAQDIEDSFSVSSLSDVKKIFKKRKYIDETDM
jgi:flagellar protein FliO/FliZ